MRVTESDLRQRQQQYDNAVAAAGLHSSGKVLSKEELEAFVDRLAADAVRRDDNRCIVCAIEGRRHWFLLCL